MRFTQDFSSDFKQIDIQGEPFALARFADGERAFCQGYPISVTADGWTYDGTDTPFALKLRAALKANLPGYHLGLPCPCCDPDGHRWYLSQVRAPLERITFSNIFVNRNYRRFKRLDLSKTVLVSSEGGDFSVPANAINPEWDYSALLQALYRVERPILVAAGPLSCVIIHDYWQHAPHRQAIVDIGSALDERIHGRRTRGYQRRWSRSGRRVCTWGK